MGVAARWAQRPGVRDAWTHGAMSDAAAAAVLLLLTPQGAAVALGYHVGNPRFDMNDSDSYDDDDYRGWA